MSQKRYYIVGNNPKSIKYKISVVISVISTIIAIIICFLLIKNNPPMLLMLFLILLSNALMFLFWARIAVVVDDETKVFYFKKTCMIGKPKTYAISDFTKAEGDQSQYTTRLTKRNGQIMFFPLEERDAFIQHFNELITICKES